MKTLLTITAILEAGTGLALLAAPSVLGSVLLGATLDAPAALAVARIAGAALISLGLACWGASKDPGSRAARGIIAAMLVYNCGAVAVFLYAAMGQGLRGIGLWPATILHAAFAIWCVACLASDRKWSGRA